VIYAIPAIACLYAAGRAGAWWKWVPGWAALVLGGLATAYACNQPGLLMKKSAGSFSLPGRVLFLPYHEVTGFINMVRKHMPEDAFDEIVPGLYLGRQLLPSDEAKVRQAGIKAVLDLTVECQEVPFLRTAHAFFLRVLESQGGSGFGLAQPCHLFLFYPVFYFIVKNNFF
jgi:hypothetical protein